MVGADGCRDAVASDALDVFFAPGYTAPLRRAEPTVVAIHDISFVAHPEWFRFREGARRRWLTSRAASQAAAVVTISQFSKRELDRSPATSRRPKQRVHVIAPGIERPGLAAERASRPSDSKPSRPQRVLFVGSIFNRRHVPDLIRAFAPIARAPHGRVARHRRRRSHVPARGSAGGDRRRTDRPQVTLASLRHRRSTAGALSPGARVRVPVGLRRLRLDAARGPGRRHPAGAARHPGGARELRRCGALYVPVGDPRPRRPARALERALFDEQTRAAIFAAAPGTLEVRLAPRAARDAGVLDRAAAPGPTDHGPADLHGPDTNVPSTVALKPV